MAGLAFGSGFSLIFSMINESTVQMASTFPVMRHTLSDVPREVEIKKEITIKQAVQ